MKWFFKITKEMVQYVVTVIVAIIEPIIDLINFIKANRKKGGVQ